MTGTVGALSYLIRRTTANRIAVQVRRLKRPRYLFFLAIGIGYFYLMFGPQSNTARSLSKVPSGSTIMVTLVSMIMAISILSMWAFSRTTASLAFLPAEVQLLFPAPISRRELLGYKVTRTQLVVMLNAVIWTVLSGRFGVVAPPPQRFAAAWGLFTVLSLHPLCLALLRVEPVSPLRKSAIAGLRVLALVIVVVVGLGIRAALGHPGELTSKEQFAAISDAISHGAAGAALAPFRALVAPFLAGSAVAFASAFAVLLGIIALHLMWVLSTRVAFEEVAANASVKLASQRAALKAFQSGGVAATPRSKTARSWLPLKPSGHPAVAIVWKNTLALVRSRMLLTFLVPIVIMIAALSMIDGDIKEEGAGFIVYLMTAGMLFMMGPRVLRNDLRQDMLSLASLKTYPLSGPVMVSAQIASPALLLSFLQTVLVLLAYVTAARSAALGNLPSDSVMLLALMPFAILALNFTNVAIQNGTVLLFPGWVRMGPSAGGIETMGQNMLMTFGSFFALVLAVILPAAVGGMLGFIITAWLGASQVLGIAIGMMAAIVVLALQFVLMMTWFGRVFDRTEASALA